MTTKEFQKEIINQKFIEWKKIVHKLDGGFYGWSALYDIRRKLLDTNVNCSIPDLQVEFISGTSFRIASKEFSFDYIIEVRKCRYDN